MPISMWRCQFCKFESRDRAEVENCEAIHIKSDALMKLTHVHWNGNTPNLEGAPDYVTLTIPTLNRVYTYRYDSAKSMSEFKDAMFNNNWCIVGGEPEPPKPAILQDSERRIELDRVIIDRS